MFCGHLALFYITYMQHICYFYLGQFRNGSGQHSGYDIPRNVDPSVKKGVGLKQFAYCMLKKRAQETDNFELVKFMAK